MFFTKYESLCKNSKKTTTGVAAELGIAKSTVAYWRANNNVIPKHDVLLKIANYFDVSVNYLLGNEEKENSDVTDTDIKVALFGGDAKDISDAAWNDVKAFAQKVAEIERKRKEYDAK